MRKRATLQELEVRRLNLKLCREASKLMATLGDCLLDVKAAAKQIKAIHSVYQSLEAINHADPKVIDSPLSQSERRSMSGLFFGPEFKRLMRRTSRDLPVIIDGVRALARLQVIQEGPLAEKMSEEDLSTIDAAMGAPMARMEQLLNNILSEATSASTTKASR